LAILTVLLAFGGIYHLYCWWPGGVLLNQWWLPIIQ